MQCGGIFCIAVLIQAAITIVVVANIVRNGIGDASGHSSLRCHFFPCQNFCLLQSCSSINAIPLCHTSRSILHIKWVEGSWCAILVSAYFATHFLILSFLKGEVCFSTIINTDCLFTKNLLRLWEVSLLKVGYVLTKLFEQSWLC